MNKIPNNPCEGCIIETLCTRMCELAKPYYEALVNEDKNFNWDEYYRRRDRIHNEWLSKTKRDVESGKKSRIELRRELGIDDNDTSEYTYGGLTI